MLANNSLLKNYPHIPTIGSKQATTSAGIDERRRGDYTYKELVNGNTSGVLKQSIKGANYSLVDFHRDR